MSSFRSSGWFHLTAAGKERWKLPLGPFNMFYGFGASPILVDDKVILPVDQDNPSSYLIAVDKNSGRVRWKVERPVVISGYSTPIVYQPKQGPKQIVIPESFQLSAYSVADGKARLVGARSGVRDEIDCQQRRRVPLHQRLGLSAEPTRTAGDRRFRGKKALSQVRQER